MPRGDRRSVQRRRRKATPVGEVVELICALAGTVVEPDIRGNGTPLGEIDRQWVDSSKLHALTGWGPRVNLEDGLRRTLDWYRSHPEWLVQGSQESVPIV